ncbi:MAG: inositol monophosphatase [Alphaproteobacteria bacterium]|nr:inositol monophosphatase [Alphaproteobacteria bacterium]
MAYLSPALTNIVNAVKKATTALTRDFNELEHLQNSVHTDNMFAVRSHEKVLNTIREELSKFKPDYVVISSKSDSIPADGNYFLVSPINGFANFAHGNANFAISVAMVENNVVVDGVIYSPIYDELFFAEKGSGAFKEGFRNHERLRIGGAKNIDKALLSCNANLDILQKALSLSPNVTVKGSVALELAYAAAGKIDAVIASDNSMFAIAAGILLVKEAGGYVFTIGETDIRTEDLNKVLQSGNIIATNEALRQKLADTMAK